MSNVLVTVETPSENQVVEVSYDGQEILQPPLTLGEHLSKQASKIDFDKIHDDEDVEDADTEDDEDMEDEDDDEADEEDGKDVSKLPTWPWESVRNKLRDAHTEMSVLHDVITISTKDCGKDPASGAPKRYMVLDGPVQYDAPDSRPYVTLLAKRKSLDATTKILLSGAQHLTTLQSDNKTNRTAQDFHLELLRLRQNWRLKKVSNTILGDLSYRTAGSQFKASGVFEVVKSDGDPNHAGEGGNSGKPEPTSKLSAGASSSASKDAAGSDDKASALKSALKVNVPSELEGIAYIQVTIQKESDHLATANMSSTNLGSSPSEMHWQKKLEAAQNVLFCKELFSQLAKEAIQLQAPIPHMVVGNQITISLFSDIQLIISLCHSTGSPSGSSSVGGASSSSNGGSSENNKQQQPQRDHSHHSHVLEHSLHQLLRLQHNRHINPDGACLSSAPVGISKRRRLAGPRAADRQALLKMANQQTLLEQIIQQAQHVVLRMGTIFILDTIAKDLKDPLITCHWGTLSSPTRTSVKVSIITAGYDSILRTQFVIHVGEKTLTVVCKDGRVLQFSHEPQELRDFLLCQISHHQINGVQALAKCTGWTVLSSSHNLGCGAVEPLGNATGCLLSNPSGDRFIAVRHSQQTHSASAAGSGSSSNSGGVGSSSGRHSAQPPQTHASVWVASAPCKDFYPGSVLKDRKWEKLPDAFQEVKLDKMDGKNLLNKLELLMSGLAMSQTQTQPNYSM